MHLGLCHGTARETGLPCSKTIHKDADADGKDLCYAHWQNQLDLDDPRRKLLPGPGRPRIDRPSEVLQKRVEEQVDKIVSVLFDALEASDTITVKLSKDEQEVIETANHAIRMKAAESLLDRAFGKPTQNVNSMNVNVGIEARSVEELRSLADAMRNARELEPGEYIDGTAEEVPASGDVDGVGEEEQPHGEVDV